MNGDPYTIAGRFTLWYAFFGGPAAWSVHLLASYAPVELACAHVGPALLVGITVAATLLSLGAVAAGWRAWSRARAWTRTARGAMRGPGEGPWAPPFGAVAAPIEAGNGAAARRTRFMGLGGMILGGYFAVTILVEGLPILLFDPCLRLP